jgi:transcriptional regulator with XRE-family HTH domain
MKNPIDLHIGQRLRNRRWLMNWTQQELANAVGIRFQQIQKYEKGDNRICSSRLWELARALEVPVTYFFEGLDDRAVDDAGGDLLEQKESIQLLRATTA